MWWPMMLAVPYLAGEGGAIGDIGMTVGTALMVLVGVLLAARRVVPRLLAFVARTRDRELFILSVFLVCFGTAWALSVAGISLALGAFLAGLVVAGSEFRHQAMSEVIPAREVLASLFFVSVGMLLNMADIGAHLIATVGLLGVILVGKFAIILGTALLLRLPLRVGILSAATLCQIGEFSFVLLNAASGTALLPAELAHNLLMAIVLSMLLTPLAIAFGPHLVGGTAYVPWLNRLLGAEPPSIDLPEAPSDHVIVAGYGLTGQRVCRAVRELGLTYVAVDRNPDKVRAAHAAGDRPSSRRCATGGAGGSRLQAGPPGGRKYQRYECRRVRRPYHSGDRPARRSDRPGPVRDGQGLATIRRRRRGHYGRSHGERSDRGNLPGDPVRNADTGLRIKDQQ